MSNADDPNGIASRIRGILAGENRQMIEALCHSLNVSEAALKMTIDENEPHPVVEVIVAVAHHYGVDPVWLVSGEGEAAAAGAPLDKDAAKAKAALAEMVARHLSTPIVSRPEPRMEA